MLYLENNYETLQNVVRICTNNSIPFVWDKLLYIKDFICKGNIIHSFSCELKKKGTNNLYCNLVYENELNLQKTEFHIIELQKQATAGWETYCNCKSVKNFSAFYENDETDYAFFDLPSGNYRMKVHFSSYITADDMNLYEQEGLFYSNEVEV